MLCCFSEESAVTEMFNVFSENKLFVFLHETPPKKMAELLDKVKGLITETIDAHPAAEYRTL